MSENAEGLDKLMRGSRLLARASLAISIEGPSETAHTDLRECHAVLRSAMNWLEGTDWFEVAHQRLDVAGALARQIFPHGCTFTYRDGNYYQECPVALAHNRVAFSVGYVVRAAECSICHEDPEDCEHIRGRMYGGERCVRIITEAELLEVSLVGRPAQPDARIESVSVTADLRERLGEELQPGMAIPCDQCIDRCHGVRRFGSTSVTLG